MRQSLASCWCRLPPPGNLTFAAMASLFHVSWFNKPEHITATGRMVSHFELYFDLVLVRSPPQPPLALQRFALPLHSLSRASQVGSFLHLGALMNLDFGNVLKEGDALAGSMSASTEQLPGLLAKIPNFTAAVVFFIALWNSWCERCHPQAPAPAHSTAASAACSHVRAPPPCQVHVHQLHGTLPVQRRCNLHTLLPLLCRSPCNGYSHRQRPPPLAPSPSSLTRPFRFRIRRRGA